MKEYFVTIAYERASQGLKGESSFNMKLPDDWDVEYVKNRLANDFFCCEIAVKEVKLLK